MTFFHRLLTAKGHALRLPLELRDDVELYVRHLSPSAPGPERAPFGRRVDLWAYSVMTAVALGLAPVDDKKAVRGHRFKDTGSVDLSPDFCTLLAAVAAAALGLDGERARDPAEIVKYANRLAAAGCPIVIERLKALDMKLTPLQKLQAHAEEMLEGLDLVSPAGEAQAVIE